jgi:hypothetical protein
MKPMTSPFTIKIIECILKDTMLFLNTVLCSMKVNPIARWKALRKASIVVASDPTTHSLPACNKVMFLINYSYVTVRDVAILRLTGCQILKELLTTLMDSLGHKALGLDIEAKRYCEIKICIASKVASTVR